MSGPDDADLDAQALALIEEWFRRQECGEPADLEELCADVPQLLPAILDILANDSAITGALTATAPPAVAPPGLPLQRIGHYRLIEQLGQGAMGRVFLAEDERLGRQVAIKLLHEHILSDAKKLLRFEREARITAALDHPNIVAIYDVGSAAGVGYMAMRRIDGPSLADLPKPLPPREVARMGVQLGHALHEAHQLGVIHRDVKPANILVERDANGDPRPVLVDFGLARNVTDVTATAEGTVTGTLLYMSPEQLRGETVTLDGRTDVYSLGATLYEALCGEPPHPAITAAQVTHDILERDPAPLRLAQADSDLETIVMRALEKDRTRRFFTAADLALDLQRYLAGDPIASRRIGLIGRLTRKARRHRRTVAAVSLLAAAVVLALALLLIQRSRGERDFQGRLVRTRELVADLRLDAADGRLLDLEAARPADPAVLALRRELDIQQALEDFLDLLPDRDVYESRERLARLRNQILGAGGDQYRRPISDLALIAAALRLGDAADAQARLGRVEREFGANRATMAFTAVKDGTDPTLALAEFERTTPAASGSADDLADQHFFAAMAFDIAGDPIEHEIEEIDRALTARPTHHRARLYHAQLLYRQGKWQAAREALRGIIREDRHRPVIIRHLAGVAMALGDLETAERELNRVPEDQRDPAFMDARTQLLLRQNQREAAEANAAAALARFPDSPQVCFSAIEIALSNRNQTPAMAARTAELLQLAVRQDLTPSQRLRVDYYGIVADRHTLAPDNATGIAELIERARRLELAARDPSLFALVARLRGQLHAAAGQPHEALDAYEESLIRVPEDPETLALFGQTLCGSSTETARIHATLQVFTAMLGEPGSPYYRSDDPAQGMTSLAQALERAMAARRAGGWDPVYRDAILGVWVGLALLAHDAAAFRSAFDRYCAEVAESPRKQANIALFERHRAATFGL